MAKAVRGAFAAKDFQVMNLDGVRNAKAEVFMEAFNFQEIPGVFAAAAVPVFAPSHGSEAFHEIVKARKEQKRDPRDLIALGLLAPSGNGDPDDWRLGIFIQQKRLIQHPIVEAAQRAAKGEARVIVTGPIRKYAAPSAYWCRPLRIGASVGHYRVTAGTLGCFAINRIGGGVGIVSNNHVLANTNRGALGDIILQPGKVDGGHISDPSSHIATLQKLVPIKFEPGAINYVDCAFAYLLDGIERITDVIGDAAQTGSSWKMGQVEELLIITDEVKKLGRTTGFTKGVVDATEIDNLEIAFDLGSHKRFARFDSQIGIVGHESAFSKPGDSGSLIFNSHSRPVALLFAGSERGAKSGHGITFANPIGTVLDALDVDIYSKA